MGKQKIALTMIVKASDNSEALLLDKALRSISRYVDGIFINVNTTEGVEPHPAILKVCRKYNATIVESVWNDNFSDARNLVADSVPDGYQWIIWLDADDTVKNPSKLRKVVRSSEGIDAIYVRYLYDFDEFNNPITVHMSARIYRNNGSHRWKGRIHETLIETRAARNGMTYDIDIVHHADESKKDASLLRNIRLLELQLRDEEKEPDPRTFFYLAGSYVDAGRDAEAKQLYTEYVKLSGWDQERSQAYTALARIAKREDRLTEAKHNLLYAIGEEPGDPEPYIELGQLEHELGNEGKALKWLVDALTMKVAPSTLVYNPQSVTYRANLLAADACLAMGGAHLEQALEYAKKAQQTRPSDAYMKQYVTNIQEAVDQKKLLKEIMDKVRAANGDKQQTVKILESVPASLDDNPLIVQLRGKFMPFTWPEKSIAIYTGACAIGQWGPWSLSEGIGGSEEAIIRVSKHLKDLGYRVVVFSEPGDRAGEYDGIQWRNHWECQLEDTFDIFIAWRNPYLFDRKITARKVYLWLHDVMDDGEFTKERLANIDKVILLSQAHKECFPSIPLEKVLFSGNGIDPEESAQFDAIERDPHRVVYQSSHVRGLEYLYEIWPRVKEAVPDATLDVYYGWHSFDKITAGNPERVAWKERMVKLAEELDGVTDHGKVDQQEVIEAASGAGIWAYPTTFYEIYCITAVKCQSAGAIPVCSNYAALEEMVQYGEKLDMFPLTDEKLNQYTERLIWWLQHPEEQDKIREDMKQWARTLTWRAVAEGWKESFEDGK